jgi:hypothetical protein
LCTVFLTLERLISLSSELSVQAVERGAQAGFVWGRSQALKRVQSPNTFYKRKNEPRKGREHAEIRLISVFTRETIRKRVVSDTYLFDPKQVPGKQIL